MWLVTSAVLFCLLAWAFYFEPASFYVGETSLTIPRLPLNIDGLTIAVLADLHTGSPFNSLSKLRKIVDVTNSVNPDLILIAGDIVIQGVLGGTFVPPEDSTKVLRALSAPLGVYAVLGNHDWWFNANRVKTALEQEGIPVLDDRAIRLSGHAKSFWLAGVSDYWEGPHDINSALRDVPGDATVIVFTHNPDVFPDIPRRVQLTIAGHTHGGQVLFPFIGRPIVPSRYGERFASGHIIEGGRHLFVSTGLGTSILPVRFRVPPEISFIRIRTGDEGHAQR